MPLSLISGQYNSFLVRVWSADHPGGAVLGQVTHVASRRSVRFRDPQQMVAFILAHLGEAPGPSKVSVAIEESK